MRRPWSVFLVVWVRGGDRVRRDADVDARTQRHRAEHEADQRRGVPVPPVGHGRSDQDVRGARVAVQQELKSEQKQAEQRDVVVRGETLE